MEDRIYNIDITDELSQSFLNYSMSVITDRALPDVRSGLKPIHTRILYGAHQLKLFSDKNFQKSAKLVGYVLASLSPHGDEATYQAIVKLVQDFYLRYPLMLGEGAWGSQDDGEAAAYRYTLCKLSKYGELMLEGIKNNVVDFKPNFANDMQEPVVLPSLFPALICNGTFGIATAMTSKCAPHNLTEVCDAIVAYIKNNNITTKEIMNYIKGPDFPQGGIVINQSSLEEFYEVGKGSIIIQGVYHFEDKGKYKSIVFTEIPYGVSKEELIEKIVTLCEKGELSGIVDVRDETTFKTGIRFVIETTVKMEEELNNIINILFDKTNLETRFSINQNAIVNGLPKLVSLKEMIKYYYEHQIDVFTRSFKNERENILIQLEKYNGLLIALANIEDIIELIKKSSNRAEAKEKLVEKYKFTELQVNTILDMKLSRLTKVDGVEIKTKQEELSKRLNELEIILSDSSKLDNEIIKKIEYMKKNYGDERRTKLTDKVREKKSFKKNLVDEKTTVIISSKGDIKRVNNYKKSGVSLICAIDTSLLSTICIFTNKGICYKIPVKKIPLVMKNSDKGEKLLEFNIENNEEILYVSDIKNFEGKKLNIITKNGYHKAIDLNECSSNRTVKYTSLKEGDEVIYCSDKDKKEVKLKTSIKERNFNSFILLKRTALGNKLKSWEENEIIIKE